ncbi:MAG: hypothetical protein LAO30_07100 [Acidobacteriia bacterium]|nr:hypothetical protein [Terriglobia bacterium]
MIDLAGDQEAHDLSQAELDGVCVLERGERDDAVLAKFHVDLAAQDAALIVEIAKQFIAHGGRSALDAVDFNVLTAANVWWIRRHLVLL